MVDQVLGIGGLSLLLFLSVRLTFVLREGWRNHHGDTELERLEL